MRYRPFNKSGRSISAITLLLDGAPMRAADRVKLINAALEAGVNGFELATVDLDVAAALGAAISAVGRSVLVITLRVGREGRERRPLFTPEGLRSQMAAALARTGAQHFDAVVLDDPDAGDLSPSSMEALQAAKAAGQARQIGILGGTSVTDDFMAAGRFDLLATPFGVRSGWSERNRIKAAVNLNMTVTGYGFNVEAATSTGDAGAPAKGLGRFFRKPDVQAAQAYDFMRQTRGWTAEALCLAFALTEPALATVRVEARSIEHLQGLAEAVEREMPTGVAAQIEMARFTAAA